MVSTKNRDLWPHSGQTTEQARDLRTSGDFRSLSRFITQISTVNLRHSSLSVLSPIILPLQKVFSRVLLLRQQAFSSGNLPPERPTTTTTAIKTQVFMFRYERVNSTRKFTIVVEIISLLKKIYKRDAPFRAVFKVKTLAVLFPPYPREMKTNTAKFNLPPFSRLLFCMEMQTHSHARSIARAWLKHAHSFDRCETSGRVQHRKSVIHRLPVTLRILRAKSDKSDWLRVRYELSVHVQKIGLGQRSRFLVLTRMHRIRVVNDI